MAIVSDIHGNPTALEAVIADLRETAPDLILQGGDLPHGGSAPAEVLDRIRDLGWPSILGNTDEMLFDPGSLDAFAAGSPQLSLMWAAIREMAAWTRDAIGPDRMEWLRTLPRTLRHRDLALVHAISDSTWRSPGVQAPDAELRDVYGPLAAPLVVYAHIHSPFVRCMEGLTIANSGSVSLLLDGDPRASYLLIDDGRPSIRRVPYDVAREIRAVLASGMPHAQWTARMLETARPSLPA